MNLREALRAEAKRCISETLADCGGNVRKCADSLGVNRTHLYRLAACVGVVLRKQKKDYGVVNLGRFLGRK